MTTIRELYKKDITRPLNPAVSAEDFAQTTIDTEIEEYVFTDEIINGLYNVLNAIMSRNVNHDGIWINGFFGSGKSHFLKYLGYCIKPDTRQKALDRLKDAVAERDPLRVDDSQSEVTVGDMNSLALWLSKANIDMVLFNIGAVHDTNAAENEVFTSVFWNQFNRLRGYNSFNLALAQNLEKVLDKAGQFDAFKQRLSAEGFDWNKNASILSKVRLDYILSVAKDLLPDITTDSIRKAIMDNKENVSPEAFCNELSEWVQTKNDENYRLLFLVDEVSQFISQRQHLLLQLQEVVTGLHKACRDQVWVACTAQQDLSQLMDNMQILANSEDYGKIMGRFEIRVSLKGSQTEDITQRRLLDKTVDAQALLLDLYQINKEALKNQFSLPSSFCAYKSDDDFTRYYPFVPYQFKLITKVLESFNALNYIDSQATGNERSIIKITHTTAGDTKDETVGSLVSFDQFYNAMFQGSLMASGQRAIENANDMIREYPDRDFAQRVVNVLFMICNLKESEQLLFPATEDHIVTLLMSEVDSDKRALAEKVRKTLTFLDQKHIIRVEHFSDSRADVYCFQSEDEIDAAREIENIQVDMASMAERLFEIFSKLFGCGSSSNREQYGSRNFTIGWTIYGRNFYTNNADIVVDFAMTKNSTDSLFMQNNDPNKLTFFVEDELSGDKLLKNDFFWYCQVQKFVQKSASSERREKTLKAFSERALDVYDSRILPKMRAILGRCKVMSGNAEVNIGGEGATRYKNALEVHFGNVYPLAKLVVADSIPRSDDELRKSILRSIEPNEYSALAPLSAAEKELDCYLQQGLPTANVSDIVRHFAARPYGWANVATLYLLNELRRRGLRSFRYNNDRNIDNTTISQNLLREQNKFTVHQSAAIAQSLVNEFVAAWKYALNVSAPNAGDAGELFRLCKETAMGEEHISLGTIYKNYTALSKKVEAYPFGGVFDEAVDLIERWRNERDHKAFFELVIAEKEQAKEIFDRCKEVAQFVNGKALSGYQEILKFLDDNRDNFEFLPHKRDQVHSLREIITDPWPLKSIPAYNAIKRELGAALDQVRKAKRQLIEQAYREVFDELRQIASDNGVYYAINEDETLRRATESDNIFILDRNCDTTNFRIEQVKDIMKRRANNEKDERGSEVSEPQRRNTRTVTLKTGSAWPLNCEDDVDRYLAALKVQLMKVVESRDENDDILVK